MIEYRSIVEKFLHQNQYLRSDIIVLQQFLEWLDKQGMIFRNTICISRDSAEFIVYQLCQSNYVGDNKESFSHLTTWRGRNILGHLSDILDDDKQPSYNGENK